MQETGGVVGRQRGVPPPKKIVIIAGPNGAGKIRLPGSTCPARPTALISSTWI